MSHCVVASLVTLLLTCLITVVVCWMMGIMRKGPCLSPDHILQSCRYTGFNFGGNLRSTPEMQRENYGFSRNTQDAASPGTCANFCQKHGFPAFEHGRGPNICTCYSPEVFPNHQLIQRARRGRIVTVGWSQSSEHECPHESSVSDVIAVNPKNMVLVV